MEDTTLVRGANDPPQAVIKIAVAGSTIKEISETVEKVQGLAESLNCSYEVNVHIQFGKGERDA